MTVTELGEMDLTPRPRPAARTRRIRAQALTETTLLLRNGEQLVLSIAIPIAILLVARFALTSMINFAEAAPSVLALALWSSGFTSTAIATGFERRYGVLERLATTPLGRTGLILGKASAVALLGIAQLIIIGAVAVILGWRPTPGWGWIPLAVISVAAVTSFVGLALTMAGQLRAEATLALANVVHLVVGFGGGLVIGVAHFPQPLAVLLRLLPTGALGDAWRMLTVNPHTGPSGWGVPLVVTAIWAVLCSFLASKAFRWTS